MSILDSIHKPHDIKRLNHVEMATLAHEIRQRMIHCVSLNGGHLAPSLGTVELTLALAAVFDFPQDQVIWDVGHQSYAWKIITGRNDAFDTLRQWQGISGFPRREESPFDSFIGGHAGVATSAALGMAAARDIQQKDNHIIAVVGDAALTNGISLEAINVIDHTTKRFILIVNDNQMSISKNVGAFSRFLGKSISNHRYNRIKRLAEAAGHKLPFSPLHKCYHAIKSAIKHLLLRNKSAVFESLGLRYIGPIDGHDHLALQNALKSARDAQRPIVLHIATTKGKGFTPAERNPSYWHGVGPFDKKEPSSFNKPTQSYSETYGETLCELAATHERIVAITAAMPNGTGLKPFFDRYRSRAYDVGICEEHACVLAAGMACSGLKPFVAIYSTFMQRAVDCVMHDICLQNLPVTLCIDRAGVVGADGATHQGLYDIAMLRCLPNLTIMQPASCEELKEMMRFAANYMAPLAIRYSRGETGITSTPTPLTYGCAEILIPTNASTRVVIWAIGDFVPKAQAVAKHLEQAGISTAVVNARFIKPLDTECLRKQVAEVELVVTLENATRIGGFGSAIIEELSDLSIPILTFGWPDTFIPHGTPTKLISHYDLDDDTIAMRIKRQLQ